MEISEAIKRRRSIRTFKRKDVSEKMVEILIDSARHAPSAGNIQPWEFVIVRKQNRKRKLANAAHQAFVEDAPVIIVVCANENLSSVGYGIRGKTLFCIQDTAAAIQNILLVAYSIGLGTCWVGAFNEDETKKALQAPRGIRPIAMITVGYPENVPLLRERKPLNQIIHHEKF